MATERPRLRRLLLPVTALALLVAALAVRVPLMIGRHDVVPGGDSGDYVLLAHRMLDGDPFGEPYRLPGYPALLALLELAGWRMEDAVVVLQHVLGAGLAVAVLVVTWRVFNPPAAVVAGALTACTPTTPYLEHAVLTDFLFAVVVFGAAVLTGWSVRSARPATGSLVAIGLLCGVGAYLRGSGQFAVLVPVIAVAVMTREWRQALRTAVVVGATFAMVLAPWVLRNAVSHGTASMTVVGGDTLFVRAFEEDRLPIPADTPLGAFVRDAAAARGDVRMVTAVTLALREQGVSRSGALRAQHDLALTAIRRHPVQYATGTLREVSELRLDPRVVGRNSDVDPHVPEPPTLSRTVWAASDVLSGAWWVVSLGTFAGIFAIVPGGRRSRAMAVAMLSMWLCLAFGTALSRGSLVRYASGLAPLSFVLGSVGAVVLARWLCSAARRLAASAARDIGRRDTAGGSA